MHTTQSTMFEIKIAVLGNVSAGKTTFINALLRDKYGAVSLGRTTACVNYFRLSYRNNNDNNDRHMVETAVSSSAAPSKEGDESSSEGTFFDAEYRTAQSTLQETTSDNATFRESSNVHVKYFDILMDNDEPLCEMREDTKLVLVDIPGINEAGAGGKYRAYVADKWDTFDCVMVVMDGRQGANTEEQVNLLEFVHKNNTEKKEIPVIILCNKVDVPEDEEQAALTKEVRKKVEDIFEAPSRDGALTQVLGESFARQNSLLPPFPAFITMSAVFAYIYRTGALMSFEQFQQFDRNLIEMIGLREVGRSVWRKKTDEEKFRLVYDTVTEETSYKEGIEATNFDKVLKILSVAVGGSNTQLQLIQKQIYCALRSLSPRGNVVAQIHSIYKRCQVLGETTIDLNAAFLKVFTECEATAFDLFSKSPCDVDSLDRPFRQLLEYWKFASAHELKQEAVQAVVSMKKMVHRQIAIILSEEAKTTKQIHEGWSVNGWSSLHPIDWMGICQSFELLSFEKVFCESFGREKMHFDKLAHKWIATAQEVLPDFGNCPRCPHPSPLDFNHFCKQCLTFILPAGYCRYCGQNEKCVTVGGFCTASICQKKVKSHPFPSFSCTSLKDSSLRLFCPVCYGTLTFNRRCGTCDKFYIAQTKSNITSEFHFSSTCIFCDGPKTVDNGWSCAQPKCKGKKIVWKVYPHSWEELFSLTYSEEDGAFAPKYPDVYNSVVSLSVPRSLSDPKHYAHISWLYCESMKSLGRDQHIYEAAKK